MVYQNGVHCGRRMSMTDKICVYFNNDYRAVFDRKDVLIIRAPEDLPTVDHIKVGNMTVVNWNNVCFIRPYEEKDQEEE